MTAYPYLKLPTTYNRRGDTPKRQMPGQALALQGFPGIVYIRRGGIHNCGKSRTGLPVPAVSAGPFRPGHSADG